jgi:hypothetical protein
MKIKSAVAALGIALTVAGAPAISSAATMQASPIHLDSVRFAQSYGVFNDFLPGLVSVDFTNSVPSTATSVVFDLVGTGGNVIAEYNDVGSYELGKTVHHSFTDTHDDVEQKIEVAKVTFADGTTWNAPARTSSTATIFPAS